MLGGVTGYAQTDTKVEVYSKDGPPTCADLVLLPDLPHPVHVPTAVYVDTLGLLVCGALPFNVTNSAICYNLISPNASWTQWMWTTDPKVRTYLIPHA